jgi:starch-binding outer membrane protein SusE/F
MKKIKFLALAITALFAFQSCDKDDLVFEVKQPGEFAFTNNFLNQYVITTQTTGNLGERLTWNNPDFGVQTNVTFEVQYSVTSDFTDFQVFGTTTENQYALSIQNLLTVANQMGLSADGNNQGAIYVRVKAYVGTSGSDEDVFTAASMMNLFLQPTGGEEEPNCEYDQLWLVGAGVPDAGWGWDSPVALPCVGNQKYAGNVSFSPNNGGNFRFFTENANWGSGINYPSFISQGFTIDSDYFQDAQDGDNNFQFIGEAGTYYLTVDYINNVITIGEAQAANCEFPELFLVGAGVPAAGWGWGSPVIINCSQDGVYSGIVNFSPDNGGNFRFFTENTNWGSGLNYPYFIDAGYTIDENFVNAQDGDSNFMFVGTAGNYLIIVDTNNKTITLE